MFDDWNNIVEGCVQGGVATINCVPAVFSNLINFFLAFIGLFGLYILILGGYKYINSAGDPKKIEGARNNLVYGALGILMVIFSFLIIRLVSDFTGVPCILKFGFGCN